MDSKAVQLSFRTDVAQYIMRYENTIIVPLIYFSTVEM